jgi:small subunit ribosomal protein S4e
MTHQKSLAAPRTLKIKRKGKVWSVKTAPGPHPGEEAVPVAILLREYLGLADNRREVRFILNEKEVLVDGRRVKDDTYPLGLFDLVSIPEIDSHYLMLVDRNGRLYPEKVDKKDAGKKLCRVTGKTVVKGGIIQINLYDGKNILMTDKEAKRYKVRDTVVIDLKKLSIQSAIGFEKGRIGYIFKGRHSGKFGKIVDFTPGGLNLDSLATLETKDGKLTTLTDYIFIVGDKEPLINLK